MLGKSIIGDLLAASEGKAEKQTSLL